MKNDVRLYVYRHNACDHAEGEADNATQTTDMLNLRCRTCFSRIHRRTAIIGFLAFGIGGWCSGSICAQNASGRETSPAHDRPSYQRWQIGGFAAGGFAPDYEIYEPAYTYIPPDGVPEQAAAYHTFVSLNFANAGFEAGRMLTRPRAPGWLRGRGEALIEVMPFWLAEIPAQTVQLVTPVFSGTLNSPDRILEKTSHGVSATPWLMRWNFIRSDDPHLVPWAQLGGGLLWTTHKFPWQPISGYSRASVINFTPQVGIGANIFLRKRQSIDFAIKAVHISNAGLGDQNPGVNITLQFCAGYSWWR